MRFENKIRFHMDIGDEIKSFSILKITLQPLAENSILHGILERGGEGTLFIGGRLEDSTIVLTVEDDGVGMAEERLAQILKPAKHHDKRGYGVANVNERIKIHYGEQYGLTYYSTRGQGTRVEIRIPAIKYGPSEREAGA